jgi:hypothetical protein
MTVLGSLGTPFTDVEILLSPEVVLVEVEECAGKVSVIFFKLSTEAVGPAEDCKVEAVFRFSELSLEKLTVDFLDWEAIVVVS